MQELAAEQLRRKPFATAEILEFSKPWFLPYIFEITTCMYRFSSPQVLASHRASSTRGFKHNVHVRADVSFPFSGIIKLDINGKCSFG